MAAALLGAAAPAIAQDGGPIPFEAVLADPDNIELGLRFAEQQIAAGNLAGAASTLERIVIRAPELNRVRLLHAVVLFRLGQVSEAAGEFALVDPESLGEADRRTLDTYSAAVRRELQTVTGSLGVTAGFHYDTNRNNFPIDGIFRVEVPGAGSARVRLPDDAQDDIGLFAIVDGRVDIRTANQRIQKISIEGAGLIDEQVELDEFDVLSGYVGVSATVDATVVDVIPGLRLRNIRLGDAQYLGAVEGQLRFERDIGADGRLRGFLDIGGGYEDFSDVAADAFASEQTGAYVTASLGAVYTPVDRLQLVGSYRVISKDAEEGYEAYVAHGVYGVAQYALSEGAAIRLGASWTGQRFDSPDPFVSATTRRRDNELSAGIGLLVSADELLSLAGAETGGALSDKLVLNIGGRYRTVFSNLENYEYDNFRFEVSITKRFDF